MKMLDENWKNVKMKDMILFSGDIARNIINKKIVKQEELQLALEYIQFVFLKYRKPEEVPTGQMMIYMVLNREHYQREIESYEIRGVLS